MTKPTNPDNYIGLGDCGEWVPKECIKTGEWKDATEDIFGITIKTTEALTEGTIILMPSGSPQKPMVVAKNIGPSNEYILKDQVFRGEGFKGTYDDGKYVYCWLTHYTPKDKQAIRKELWLAYSQVADMSKIDGLTQEFPMLTIGYQLRLVLSNKVDYNKHAVEVRVKFQLAGNASPFWYSLGFLPKEKGIDAIVRQAIKDGKIDPHLPVIHIMTSQAPVKDKKRWPLYNVRIAIPYGDTSPDGLDRKSNGYRRLAELIL